MIDWKPWRGHFERQSHRTLPMIAGISGAWPAGRRETLARSLAIFQLGEAGGGRIAKEIDDCRLTIVDDDYRSAIKLFVAEEHRHGKILARIVLELRGRLLTHTWTESLFQSARRVMGLRMKVLVLLVAEVIGIAFYGALAGRLPLGSIRFSLSEICHDEEFHLRFHAAFFRAQLGPLWKKILFAFAWHLTGLCAMAVVLWDHRQTLRAFKIPLRSMAWTFIKLLRRAYHASIDGRLRDELLLAEAIAADV
jgi:hypothetical protein